MKRAMKDKLNLASLLSNEMNDVKAGAEAAGETCGCSCYYADDEGSSVLDNFGANADHGWWSPVGDIQMAGLATITIVGTRTD